MHTQHDYINQLVADLKPKKTLNNLDFWLYSLLCLLAFLAIVLAGMGVRYDYPSAIKQGSIFWKSGIFFLVWLASLMVIIDISRPTGKFIKTHFVPFLLGLTILIWQYAYQLYTSPHSFLAGISGDSSILCITTITLGGLCVMALAWKYWLKQTASPYPKTLGAFTGLSAGSLVAGIYALHCHHDAMAYISVFYFMPIVFLMLMGALLGHKMLQW